MPIKTLPLGVTAVMLPDLDFAEQLALCQKLAVTHMSLRPRHIPAEQVGKPWGNWGNHKFDLTPERLVKEAKQIRKQMDDAGITVFGTVPACNIVEPDDSLKVHFEGAAAVGAGRVRVAVEPYPKTSFDYPAFLDKTVKRYQQVVKVAKGFGQKVVIETHSYSMAASPSLAWNICRHFSPDDLGTIFDIANFNIEGNYVPHLAVAVLDKYIDHVHIGGTRRTAGVYDAAGFRKLGHQQCALTEADLYMPAWLEALHHAGHHVPLMIENFADGVPGAVRLTDSAIALHRALELIEA